MGKLVKTIDFLTGGKLLDPLKPKNNEMPPLPEPPEASDEGVQDAGDAARKRRKSIMAQTVMTSNQGVDESSQVVQRKTLLGARGDG